MFQPAAIRRLREIGAWMAANSEAIHGTRRAPCPEPAWGRVTTKTLPDGSTRFYAHVFDPQPGAVLTLTGMPRPARGKVLETAEPVAITPADGGFAFTLPAHPPDPDITVIAFE